jgi:catalase-peroxidase
MTEEAKCPVPHGVGTTPSSNNKWWPNQLSTAALIHHSEKSDPFGPDFDYVAEFKSLCYEDFTTLVAC